MNDPLDLVHLRSLVAIADCGGFHRAAAALQLSQSTVSQHVRQLERIFKQPLVEKAGRSTRFTIAGESVLDEARQILAVHDQAMQRLEVRDGQSILVGCTEHAADQLLPGLLGALRTAFPGRQLRFRLDRSTSLEEKVGRGVLDLAVVLAADEASGTRVGDLALNWLAEPGFESPSPGQAWPLVVFEEPCGLRRRALQSLRDKTRTGTIVAESTSLDGVVAGVRAGLGVALLPSAGRIPDGLRVVHELPALGSAALHVVARRGIDPALERTVCDVTRQFLAQATWPQRIPA